MKPYYVIYLLAVCSLAIADSTSCSCGHSLKKHDGQEDFPFVVRVVNTITNKTMCTAAILTDSHLVTSVHCSRFIGKQPVYAVAGEGSENVQTLKISRNHQEHAIYNPDNSLNDIAILFLESPLKFSETVIPICVPDGRTGGGVYKLLNQNVKLIGWDLESSSLKTVDAKVSPANPCRKVFPKYIPNVLFPTQMCTFQEKGACIQNMGSPVVYLDPKINKYVLVGIVSYGKLECNSKFPTVETDVSVYLRWIEYVVKRPLCHIA
ncbi:unnamed protein product [Nezara viridula]|nr:unnamed protein product [Nezara viridula]